MNCTRHFVYDEGCYGCRDADHANRDADFLREQQDTLRAHRDDLKEQWEQQNREQINARTRSERPAFAAAPLKLFPSGLSIALVLLAAGPVLVLFVIAVFAFTVFAALIQALAAVLPFAAVIAGVILYRRRSKANPWERVDRAALAAVTAGTVWVLAAIASSAAGTALGVLLILGAVVAAWFTYRLDPATVEKHWPQTSLLPTVIQHRVNERKERSAAMPAPAKSTLEFPDGGLDEAPPSAVPPE